MILQVSWLDSFTLYHSKILFQENVIIWRESVLPMIVSKDLPDILADANHLSTVSIILDCSFLVGSISLAILDPGADPRLLNRVDLQIATV